MLRKILNQMTTEQEPVTLPITKRALVVGIVKDSAILLVSSVMITVAILLLIFSRG